MMIQVVPTIHACIKMEFWSFKLVWKRGKSASPWQLSNRISNKMNMKSWVQQKSLPLSNTPLSSFAMHYHATFHTYFLQLRRKFTEQNSTLHLFHVWLIVSMKVSVIGKCKKLKEASSRLPQDVLVLSVWKICITHSVPSWTSVHAITIKTW